LAIRRNEQPGSDRRTGKNPMTEHVIVTIRTAGIVDEAIEAAAKITIIDDGGTCGTIKRGDALSAYLPGSKFGFVISWQDLEVAYLTLKKNRGDR